MIDSRGLTADHRLATYGTLAPGRANHQHVSAIEGRWLRGHVHGTLVDAGWGAAYGFPGILLGGRGEDVAVDVLESPDLPEHWPRLDEFEGPGYRRVATTASTPEGRLEVSIYVLAETPAPAAGLTTR